MTAEIAARLQGGIALHQAGRLEEAESVYESALRSAPETADAWHLLARAALDRGDAALAIARVIRALRIHPTTPAFHNTLGEILLAQGKSAEAIACCREALRLDVKFVPALINLGNALQGAGDLQGAAIAYWKAIDTRPNCAEAFTNLGNVMRREGEIDDAVACYREALRLNPASAEACINLAAGLLDLGDFADAEASAQLAASLNPRLHEAFSNLTVALLNQSRFDEAEAAARQALDRAPLAAHLHVNLASVLLKQRRLDESEAAARRALELRPDYPEAANNLGLTLQAMDRLEEAAQWLGRAVTWKSAWSEAWTNLGTIREAQNRPADALACFDRAIADRPDFPKAHFCRALTLLRAGRMDEGFAEYEWRWRARRESPRAQSLPAWDGSPAHGKTILVYAEQGLGDTIQFARYIRLVADLGARVVLECQKPLMGLAARFEGVAQVIGPDDPLPLCDVQAALMSLPHLLQIGPASAPYLQVPRLETPTATRPRIGLAWKGNPQHAADRHRSIALDALSLLQDLPVQWISIHKEPTTADWLHQPLAPETGVEDLAALMGSLDLILTIDSMPAHLAGALGRPVWVLLSHVPDWRWQMDRTHTPWYPTMRLFRQDESGWAPVIERVACALREEFSQGLRHDADMQ